MGLQLWFMGFLCIWIRWLDGAVGRGRLLWREEGRVFILCLLGRRLYALGSR